MPNNDHHISTRELEVSIAAAASTYRDEERELRDREKQVVNTLKNTIAGVLNFAASTFIDGGVPATARCEDDGTSAMLTFGSAPLTTATLTVKKTADARLVVIEERTRPGGNLERKVGEPRRPSDFGGPHFRTEIEGFIEWAFETEGPMLSGRPIVVDGNGETLQ